MVDETQQPSEKQRASYRQACVANLSLAGLQKYTDRFRPNDQPKLTEVDLDSSFFPPDIWQRHFHSKAPVTKQKGWPAVLLPMIVKAYYYPSSWKEEKEQKADFG